MATPKYYSPLPPAGWPDYATLAAATVDQWLINAAKNGGMVPDTAKLIRNQQAATAAGKGPDPNAFYAT
jgi:hypothetical protein